ncbi:MAG: SagB/ThcOx family dehydrogenase [Syntrophobacteraceae bacterium]|nr:SagB/ThcOx family dehydrogenase [Syntrophobacteraceae bacterium]
MEERRSKDVFLYHERTKHHFHRFARSLGVMDWKNQPVPFRSFSETWRIPLPLLPKDPEARHGDLYERGNNQPQPMRLENVAAFLELSLGLSAWKAISGSRWSLRMNPSSGNLHPTECHLILPAMDPLEAGGVYHYNPLDHALEARAEVGEDIWKVIGDHFGRGGFFVGLSSIYWRESWKYGERAFRYCNHDVGHALAALSFSANLQGWKLNCLDALSDEQVETLLGFDRTVWRDLEEEVPETLCFVCANGAAGDARGLPGEVFSAFEKLSFNGRPNALSANPVEWEAIESVHRACQKPETAGESFSYGQKSFYGEPPSALSAAQIIRKRRSGLAFDESGFLNRNPFLSLLDKTIPRNDCAPFDMQPGEPRVNLLLFVHNVHGLARGLYFYSRSEQGAEDMRRAADPSFLWDRVETGEPLYLLRNGDFRQIAARLSCNQEIAGYGVFSLGMIAAFGGIIEKEPYRYRRLFWEVGAIGQVLYLEAEAHGIRGTGIGCFFDDPVHDLLGLTGNSHQSLYHFAAGLPVEDPRLTTLPPYTRLRARFA